MTALEPAPTAPGQGASMAEVQAFLAPHAPANAFLLGNLTGYGFHHKDMQETWLSRSGTALRAVCMRHFSNALLYFPMPDLEDDREDDVGDDVVSGLEDDTLAGFIGLPAIIELIRSWRDAGLVNRMSGPSHCMSAVADHLPSTTKPMILATCRQLSPAIDEALPPDCSLKSAPPHLPLLNDIMDAKESIPEFIVLPGARELFISAHERGLSRSLAIVGADGRLWSAASSAGENASTAMIVGVFTLPTHRRRGLAELLMRTLATRLLSENKLPTLFYENPLAAALYHRIGFAPTGDYSLLYFK